MAHEFKPGMEVRVKPDADPLFGGLIGVVEEEQPWPDVVYVRFRLGTVAPFDLDELEIPT